MSATSLVLRVVLHDARYHGRPEWPPAPGRLFQALVAGASRRLREPDVAAALRWFERLPAPVVCAPKATEGQRAVFYMPNNDLDAKGGDPARVSEIRAEKVVQPRLLASPEFLYVYELEAESPEVALISELTDDLYQFGRGWDMAYARAETLPDERSAELLASYAGSVFRPTGGASRTPERELLCPRPGTFDSLERRHAAQGQRFAVHGSGRKAITTFAQPPKALMQKVAYASPAERMVFDLARRSASESRAAVSLTAAHGFVVEARDAAVERLGRFGRQALVEAALIGRKPGAAQVLATSQRVHLTPLPSIGHPDADPRIRRLLVEVPSACPLEARDVHWAFSNLELEVGQLLPGGDRRMLEHYTAQSATWESVTPLALPAPRRRIEPSRRTEERKPASERGGEEARARSAVRHALRHAQVAPHALSIEVQREPWRRKGARAEAFSAPPRFAKERLWHVRVRFAHPLEGPLVLGDGRFLGLGLMRPVSAEPSTFAWQIRSGLESEPDPEGVARALRRAVMSLAQGSWRRLPSWVSGHTGPDTPAEGDRHLYYLFDPPRGRLVVWDPRPGGDAGRRRLRAALEPLSTLRAGRAGLLELEPTQLRPQDPLLRPARVWTTLTPYRVNRHAKRLDAAAAVERDVRAELEARSLPKPVRVEIKDPRPRSGIGLEAEVTLEFKAAVSGPLALGKSRHHGGGLFVATGESSSETR